MNLKWPNKKNRCYFDKRGIWHECGKKEKNCDDCKFEYVIARTLFMYCHWCRKEIVSNRIRAFCDKKCRDNWSRATRVMENLKENTCHFWTEGFGPCPIQTEEELDYCQKLMLGYVREGKR